MGQDETRRHFELRNLDQDMRKAYAETLRVDLREHVRRLKAENLGILIMLTLIAVIGGYVFSVF